MQLDGSGLGKGAPAKSPRSLVRHATAASHARLHEHPAFARLLRADITRSEYSALLLRLLGLHLPIEERLARYAATPAFAWRSGTVSAATGTAGLHADLRALGTDDAAIAGAPRADAMLPVLDNAAAALGCAWVVEGAAPGGRIMARQVAIAFGPGVAANSFLALPPGQTERWQACCAAIEACGADPAQGAAMCAAATATFEAFEAWLEDWAA